MVAICSWRDWRHPEGPASTLEGRENHPVVQIAWEDAMAYAKWAGNGCRPRLNSSLRPVAERIAIVRVGSELKPGGSGRPTFGRDGFRRTHIGGWLLADLSGDGFFGKTGLGCMTSAETCGNGAQIGTVPIISLRWLQAALRSIPRDRRIASILRNPVSQSAYRRADRFCVAIATVLVIWLGAEVAGGRERRIKYRLSLCEVSLV